MGFALFLLFIALTYLRPIEAYAPELVVYRPMLVLMLLTFVAAFWRAMKTRQVAASAQDLRVFFGFVACIAISVAATGWFSGALYAVVDFAPTLLIFLTIVMTVTDIKRLRTTCALIIACMMVLSIFGALAYHTGYMADKLVMWQTVGDDENMAETEADVIPADDTSGTRLWRVRSLGFLSDPNDFGQALVVAVPMLLMFYERRRAFRNLFVVGIPGAIMMYGIYLTHSRGALLGLGSLMFFTIKRVLGTTRTAVLLGAMVVGAMALNFTGGRAYTANEESAGGRVDAWSEGLNMFSYRPIFGVGYHNFTKHHSHTAHNSFVLCFAETGIVGYLFWLGLIVLAFKQTTRAMELAPKTSDGYRWAAAMRTSLIGFLTCSFFLSRSYEPGLFIALALAYAAWFSARESVAPDSVAKLMAPVKWRAAAFTLLVVSIFAIYVIVVVKNATIGRSI